MMKYVRFAFYKLVTIYNNLYPQASFNGSTKNLPARFQVSSMRIYFHDGIVGHKL